MRYEQTKHKQKVKTEKVIKLRRPTTAVRSQNITHLQYLDIVPKNKYEKNKVLLQSNRSVLKVMHKQVSLRIIAIGFKRSGIKIGGGLKYSAARFVVLKSLNATVSKLDKRAEAVKRLQMHEVRLARKENLRFFLRKNFLPCNGQRTRNNAQTCKKKRKSSSGVGKLETQE